MIGLQEQLQRIVSRRAVWVGIGNPDLGDDGLGVRLAEKLQEAGCADVILAGTTPENRLRQIEATDCDTVVFLDATKFGGAPGSVTLFDHDEIVSRHPQVSTHKLSLGFLAKMLTANAGRQVRLLAVEPERLTPHSGISATVQETLDTLTQLLINLGAADPVAVPDSVPAT